MKRSLVVSGQMIPGVTLGSTFALSAVILAMKGERMNEIRLRVPGEGRGGEIGVIVTAIKKVYSAKWVVKEGSVPKVKQLELVEKKGVVRVYVVRTQHNRLPAGDQKGCYIRTGFVFRLDTTLAVEDVRGVKKNSVKNPISHVFATKETVRLKGGKRMRRKLTRAA